jgi:hypothetical protein
MSTSELLQEALRILRSRPSSIDKRRIARTLYKLSLVLKDLGDGLEKEIRQEARQLRFEVTGEISSRDSEEDFDNLVAYV